MADDNDIGRRRSQFTSTEVNRAVQAANKARAYATKMTPAENLQSEKERRAFRRPAR